MPGDDVQLDEVAAQLRAVLAALADPDDELDASAATRNRIEGAACALDALSRPPAGPGQVPDGPSPGSPR